MARVESLLAAGDVRQALKLATKIVERRPKDAAAHLLLGRVNYARPIVGRFPALEEFRTAARLAPADPEPLYWQMTIGSYLRSDDGDWIAREALLGLFAVTPNYKDAWERFRDVYRSPDIWRRAERALAGHARLDARCPGCGTHRGTVPTRLCSSASPRRVPTTPRARSSPRRRCADRNRSSSASTMARDRPARGGPRCGIPPTQGTVPRSAAHS